MESENIIMECAQNEKSGKACHTKFRDVVRYVISEETWSELAGLLIAEGNNEDIINAVSCTEGWVYIENHVVRECFPEHYQKSIDEAVIA